MRIKPIFPLLPGFLLLASILLSSPAYMQEQRGLGVGQAPPAGAGRYYALVIGNNAYTSLPRLKTAEADAREVAALLKDSYGFETKLLLNATRSQIVSALSAYRLTLAPDANLLIYYAGHGINDKEADKAYWLPVDASRDDSSNWIIADEITTGIKVIPARHVLIVSDSCYSGTLTRGLGESLPRPTEREQFLKKMAAGKSRTLMASGGDEPVADGGGGGKHSVFANALLRGLREMDKGQFTAAELFRHHVEEAVGGRANQTPEYNPLRNSGHESGDFIFVRVKVGDKTVEVTVKTPPSAPFNPLTIELSYWDAIKNSTDPEDFKDYLQKYPNGQFADIARRRASGGRGAAAKMLSFDFNAAKGILATNAALGEGLVLSGGSLRIESAAGSNLIMPAGLRQVAFFLGPALIKSTAPAGLTCGELTFTDGDLAAISVTRPGVTGGASTPAWQMQAFNAGGTQVGDTVGEGDIINGNYLFPPLPQDFTITAAGIRKMQLCSKNHQSTFGAIPVARINRTLEVASAAPAGGNTVSTPTSAPRPTPTNAAPVESSDPATELAFWDAVKNSTSGDDLRAYLKRFPDGTFADLANNRLKLLEKGEEARRAAEEIAKRTKSFRGSYGIWSKIFSDGVSALSGELVISTGKIEFRMDDKPDTLKSTDAKYIIGVLEPTPEGIATLPCSRFDKAMLEGNFIREIPCSADKCRFNAESAVAASALAAIREACNLTGQTAPRK